MQTNNNTIENNFDIEENPKELIKQLQREVNEKAEIWIEQMFGICEKLDYHNSSIFSYNIDRLSQFVKELQDFNIIDFKNA